MQLIRWLDQAAVDETPQDQRFVQRLLDRATGAANCSVSWIRTPPSGGSPEGLHVHDVDQVFYVLAGVMHIEFGGEVSVLSPGSLVFFPAGQPHRNWNEGGEPTVHLAINSPAPDPDVPFARPAG
jgi:quercetin dioxygenase-like cupin family protein